MADITNAQAVEFTNKHMRQCADAVVSAYWTAKAVAAYADANKDIATALAVDTKATIADNADKDGRPIATSEKVTGALALASEMVADMEANSNAKLNTWMALAVNGRSRV